MARKTWDEASQSYVDGYTPSKPKNSGGGSNFVDPSVLQDAQINGLSKAEIDKKWGGGAAAAVDVYDKTYGGNSWDYGSKRNGGSGYVSGYDDYDYNLGEEEEEEPPVTITGGYMKDGKWYNEYSDGTTGLASDWNGIGAGSTNWKQMYGNTDLYKNLESKFGQSAADNAFYYMFGTGQNKQQKSVTDSGASEDITNDYTMANITSYNDAFNRYKNQGMSDEDARAAASKDVENQNLMNSDKKKQEEIANSTNKDDDAIASAISDVMGGETPSMNDQTVPEWWTTEEGRNKYVSDAIESAVSPYMERMQQSSTTIKKSVPEEEDNTFDRNTYFNENMADKTMHAGGESKDIQSNGLTFAKKFQEPTTAALKDLGLIDDSTAVAPESNATQGKSFESGQDVVADFNNAINGIVNTGAGTDVSAKKAISTYNTYKKELENMVANKKITSEEYKELLEQLRTNEQLQEFTNNYNNRG